MCNLKIYKSALPKRYGPLPVTPTKNKAPRSPTTLSLCKFANFIPALQVKKIKVEMEKRETYEILTECSLSSNSKPLL